MKQKLAIVVVILASCVALFGSGTGTASVPNSTAETGVGSIEFLAALPGDGGRILAFSMDVNTPVGVTGGSQVGAGKISFKPVTVERLVDEPISPRLYGFLLGGSRLTRVFIKLDRPAQEENSAPLVTWTLKGARVIGYKQDVLVGERLSERITFGYREICQTIEENIPQGSTFLHRACWNVAENRPGGGM